MIELLTSYLAATLGKSNEEIAAILFKKADDGTLTDQPADNALEALQALNTEHLASVAGDEAALKAEYDKGHSAGKFEALSKAEESIAKKYGLQKGKLETMLDALVKKASDDAGSEDKVLLHPLYTAKAQEAEAAKSDFEARLKEMEEQTARSARRIANIPKINQVLAEAGAKIPTEKARAAFMAEFEGLDFQVEANGKTYLKGPDGKLLKDANLHPVTLEKYVETIAVDWFEISKQPPVQSPGNPPGPTPPPPTKWTKDTLPKTAAEFEKAFFDIKDPAAQAELAKAWQDSQSTAT